MLVTESQIPEKTPARSFPQPYSECFYFPHPVLY